MRSIKPLKRILNTHENIIFVDNEISFKNMVKEKGYAHCFTDMFGGDFGHCTPEGNKLLAENIMRAVTENIFKESTE